MSRTVYIYALIDPTDNQVRYVGKSTDMKSRFRGHLCDKSKTHKTNWLKSLKVNGKVPEMVELEKIVECGEDGWQESERFWISYLRSVGANLCNLDIGGGPNKEVSLETRIKIGSASRGKKRGPQSPEHLAKRIAALTGKPKPPKDAERLRNLQLGKTHSEETRKKISAALRGRKFTEEHCNKIGEALKNRVPPPGSHCWKTGWAHTQEVKERIGKLNRGRKLGPRSAEYMKNLQAAVDKYWKEKRAKSET